MVKWTLEIWQVLDCLARRKKHYPLKHLIWEEISPMTITPYFYDGLQHLVPFAICPSKWAIFQIEKEKETARKISHLLKIIANRSIIMTDIEIWALNGLQMRRRLESTPAGKTRAVCDRISLYLPLPAISYRFCTDVKRNWTYKITALQDIALDPWP